MIRATLLTRNGKITGFDLAGHAGYAESGKDVICAAVSSAVYMAANTITDICRCPAEITEAEGRLRLQVAEDRVETVQTVLKGLELHLAGMVAQYPQFIQIQKTEV